MVPVFLLVVGIGILLLILILLALFFVPVIARIALGKTPESGYLLFQASWGWIGTRIRTEGKEYRQEFLFGDHALFSKTAEARKVPAPEVGQEPRKAIPLTRRISSLLKLVRPLASLGIKVLRSMTLQEFRGRMIVGLANPADTGILYGWYWALRPLLSGSRVELEVTPAFDREILEGEIMASVRIDRPLLLLIAAGRVFLDRDARAALAGLREG